MRAKMALTRPGEWFSISFVLLLTCCSGGNSTLTTATYTIDTAFDSPEKVTIIGYSGSAMEPFISRDGAYLFFNNFGGPTGKDLFYATFIDETTYQFQGAITAINTAAVDGVPTMDTAYTFYYVTTANYNPPDTYDTLYRGTWNGSTVTDSAALAGLALTTPGIISFDIEISADGTTIYFADGDFSGGKGFPETADIVIAVDRGNGFVRDPKSETITANLNTTDLEYASCVSGDGLELFFTRLNIDTLQTWIYRSTRPEIGSAFAAPELIDTIDGFVEAPTLSPDEQSLYYHRLNTDTGLFEIYRVTRPIKG